MKADALLRELDALARRLGYGVRMERGRFRGGRCRVEGQKLVVLNRMHTPETNAALLARALAHEPLGEVFVPPAVRKALDDARALLDADAPNDDGTDGDMPGNGLA